MSETLERQRPAEISFTGAFAAAAPTPDKKATLLGITQKLIFAIYPEKPEDKEAFQRLYPFFCLSENIRLYDCKLFVVRANPPNTTPLDEGAALILIKNTSKFGFVRASYDYVDGAALIQLGPRNGDEKRAEALSVKISLSRSDRALAGKRD